ncbi:PREDICTED: probable vacuolar amino acid transporter YPQ1 [Camelina sativa]|uniref:Probable vacuolar amino acid transporter YPQ1 n=1 Tax=Camelina sativa TaxID=90675 RepID=A0ABM0U671_CAMSA|nr:PREDICTED: probable vacuolar amino acid transporter YPQ1 [Camelina sativa]
MLFRDGLSMSLGVISVISWSVAEIPQIISNYNQKSIDGVSIAFLTTWMLGDIFNIVGCLLEPASLAVQFYTAVVYALATLVLYVQSIYYGHIYPRLKNRRNHQVVDNVEEPLLHAEATRPSTKSMLCVVSVFLFLGSFNMLSGPRSMDLREKDRVFVVVGGARKLLEVSSGNLGGGNYNMGMLLGWAMAAIYLGGRVPQICMTMRNGHAGGLNPLMFFFAFLGNVTYVASILVKSVEWSNIKPNLPWLVDAGGCPVLDFIILLQIFYFRCGNVNKDSDKKGHETGEESV